ncbi:DUF456 family protein [Halorubrum lacusprofundi]|jgi:hypothetical protein|uniref:DUF456 domain-containing protein n=1 Tax=Halorubrum lacusprofundi (strain ATCC 49239 / DSM 5036 / JCM 8891 / ACAM 34) TaxID=416348 RepID=B9LQ72_HALLT|nr:DUF456 family protein [Halorubrum lacusprofundi]ACM57510.1 protein of unknown function DUF456 [Halorubrum lacusprofundi ATCC 49239]MCG1005893.1 DUF456 domain-containing protein [Halorubrum lacusprofundi]
MVFSAAEIAIVLLVVWTASSFVPFVPSGVLAALTVIGYTYTTGFTEPSLTVLLALVLVSLLASAVELLSGMLSGKLGGASTRTVAVGTLVGIVLLFVMGPIGLVVGVGGTVFLGSLYENGAEPRVAVRQSVYAVIGVFAGPFVQAVILAGVAVAFAISVL